MNDPQTQLRKTVRTYLQQQVAARKTITYQALAQQFQLRPPNTIGQITTILEQLMQEDATAGKPFIAAIVVGKSHGGLPAPGFFQRAAQLGRDIGDMTRTDMKRFHASELQDVITFWRTRETS